MRGVALQQSVKKEHGPLPDVRRECCCLVKSDYFIADRLLKNVHRIHEQFDTVKMPLCQRLHHYRITFLLWTPNLCKYLEKTKYKRHQCRAIPNGAVYWLRYGVMKMDYTMIAVNIFAAALMGLYLIFYYFMTKEKFWISIEVCAVIFLISLMLLLVQIFEHDIFHPLGFICMTFNILNFGAPLAGLKVVLRQRSCEALPLPMCIANLLVSNQWALYGVLVSDVYIITPNAIGMLLAMVQMALFLIFPMKQGGLSPTQRCFNPSRCVTSASSSSSDENGWHLESKLLHY
ncbi:unnamed protein product [Litomosoides sigmodontis]|uniref:Sugar transporter SWEET n=1 Tax=Litomosoides sigmodontis TaxID=42156 RepID=A0A3P6SLA5_LITSI|nr:unnamed protein product [Litomosoides sigmodontis]